MNGDRSKESRLLCLECPSIEYDTGVCFTGLFCFYSYFTAADVSMIDEQLGQLSGIIQTR